MQAGVDLGDRHHFTLMCKDFSQLGQFVHVDNAAFRAIKAATPGSYTFNLLLADNGRLEARDCTITFRRDGTKLAVAVIHRDLEGLRAEVEFEKTIALSAAVQQVWELWSNFANFPRFMAHLREVRKIDDTRSHWVAVGPAGVPVEWDAIVTDWVPQQFIGWTSVPGSPVETTGQVRFRRVGEDRSEIDVRLAYNPPGGLLGHAVAALWGTDPKSAMDDDLVRFKSLLEEGKTTASGEQVRLEEVAPASAARPA